MIHGVRWYWHEWWRRYHNIHLRHNEKACKRHSAAVIRIERGDQRDPVEGEHS